MIPSPCTASRTASKHIKPAGQRTGIAIISAFVALLVLSTLTVTLVGVVLTGMRQADQQNLQLQAESLAESAIARAMVLRKIRPDDRSEVWTPTIEGVPPLRAEMEWTTVTDGTVILKVMCTVSSSSENSVRVERTRTIPAPTPQAN